MNPPRPLQGELPLVSIITPAYNGAEWLPRCLASVAAQDYARVEHVVMDAASDDGTVALLRASSAVWRSEPDDGQSDAINKGVALAKGTVLTWLNADDELLPDAVSSAVEALQRSRAAWVVGAAELREGTTRRVVRPRRITERVLDMSNPILQPAVFFTRHAWERVGGVDPEMHLAMDLDLWYRFVAAGMRPHVTRKILAVAHVHPLTKTRALPVSDWYYEMGRARAKNGRQRAAGVEFGRSLGERLAGKSPAPTEASVAAAASSEWRHLRDRGLDVSRTAVTAGAAVRLAVLEPGRRRWRYLLRPQPWATRQTRHEIVAALRTRLRASPQAARD